MAKVAVVMGSEHDLPVVRKAINALQELKIECEVRVLSAHRSSEACAFFSRSAQENGFGVIIAAAGKAAHLAGAIAANTVLPVIGLPIKGSTLDGMDALLSTVQMPWHTGGDGGHRRRGECGTAGGPDTGRER